MQNFATLIMFSYRFLILIGLILSPLATFFISQLAALAGTDTTTINISGTVPSVVQISSPTTMPVSNDLPLSNLGQQVIKIAELQIINNNPNSPSITINASSTNSGALSSANGNSSIPYLITVTDHQTPPNNFDNINNFSSPQTSGFNAEGAKTVDLYIQFNQATIPKQGDYSDVITLTVSDN